MKAGRLVTSGIVFLRGTVYHARTSAGEEQYIFPVVERLATGVKTYTLIWTGPEAATFVKQHGAVLKPGKAIDVCLHSLFHLNNEPHYVIYTATLAPDRWETRPATTTHSQPAPQEAHA